MLPSNLPENSHVSWVSHVGRVGLGLWGLALQVFDLFWLQPVHQMEVTRKMIAARKTLSIIIFFVISMVFVLSSFADDAPGLHEWRGGPHIGFSLYTGIIGAEIQKGHYGLTLGLPESIGFKFYPDERGYRWFYGLHVLKNHIDEKEVIDNIPYDKTTVVYSGLGFGYRWRWFDHLDLSASLSATYVSEKRTGPYAKRTEKFLGAYPGITIGYTF